MSTADAFLFRFRRLGVALLVATLGIAITGCGGPDTGGRLALSGTIKFKGQPLDHGTIEFVSADRPQSGATVKDGKYSIAAEQGLKPGTYTVRISSVEEDKGPPPPPGPENTNQLGKELIPAEYNVQSKKTVEVTDKGPNRFDFDIP